MLKRFSRVAVAAMALACAALAADITGSWEFAVETSQGSGTPSFEFKQDGETLTGTYSGQFGSAKLSGTVKGDQVDFTFDVPNVGKAHYKGTLDGAARMKGKVEYGDLAEGMFTAKRK